jgi:Asp-tRNA(Asn)/Glu-tRNA(Gln) amidotransferase B subunit
MSLYDKKGAGMNQERKRILDMLGEGKISASEAEELLDALGKTEANPGESVEVRPKSTKNVKFMYVKVLSAQQDNVDVRVPLGLIRAGMRFTALIPPLAMEHINRSLKENGVAMDLTNFKPDDIEELIANLAEMEVNVKSNNGDIVKVYCGE